MNFFFFVIFVLIAGSFETLFNPNNNIWLSLLIWFGTVFAFELFSLHTERITIKSKSTKKSKFFNSNSYTIKTTDGRVFSNYDSWLFFKTDAKQLHTQFKTGQTFEIKTYRVFLSNVYNILSAKNISESEKNKTTKQNIKINKTALLNILLFCVAIIILKMYNDFIFDHEIIPFYLGLIGELVLLSLFIFVYQFIYLRTSKQKK